MKPLTQLVLLAAGVYVVLRVMKGRKEGLVDESANFVNSSGGPRGAGIIPKTGGRCLCNGIRRDCPCPSSNFSNSTGDGGDWRYQDSPWSASVNAAGLY